MRKFAPTQTWGKTLGGISFSASTLCLPFGGKIEVLDGSLIVKTNGFKTDISPSNVKAFRYFVKLSYHNIRIISDQGSHHRAVDIRLSPTNFPPDYFASLGFDVDVIQNSIKSSFNESDQVDYGIVFDTT